MKFHCLFSINNLAYKSSMLEKYGKKLKYLVKDYLIWESKFGIDHTLIKANNHKRTYLGLRSESYTNNIVMPYINEMNKINEEKKSNIQYFYEKNIDVIKKELFKRNINGFFEYPNIEKEYKNNNSKISIKCLKHDYTFKQSYKKHTYLCA